MTRVLGPAAGLIAARALGTSKQLSRRVPVERGAPLIAE